MTHQPKKSLEFSVPHLWDGVLCMCDLVMKIHKKNKNFPFLKVLETILGIIYGRKCVLRTNNKLNKRCKTVEQ